MQLSRRLWRWNAYVVFVVGLLAIALLVVSLAVIALDELDDGSRNAVSVAPERVTESSTRFGNFEIVPGADVLRAPLYLDQKLAAAISKENTSVQNYLFYDPAAATSYWLLDGPPTLLASAKFLPTREYGELDRVLAVVYEQVSRDTNGDELLTGADLKTIALSDPTGRRFKPLLEDITDLHAAEMMKDDTIVLVYTAASKMHAANVDPATFRVIRDITIEGHREK